jgi:hypothetical protein
VLRMLRRRISSRRARSCGLAIVSCRVWVRGGSASGLAALGEDPLKFGFRDRRSHPRAMSKVLVDAGFS